MSITCPECAIRYASELPACPWCGHVAAAAGVASSPVQQPAEPATPATPTHTERAAATPRPPQQPEPSGRSTTYDPANIKGPDEEWEPIDEWLDDDPGGEDDHFPAGDRVKRRAIIAAGAIALMALGAWLAEVLPIGVGSHGSAAPPPATAAPTTLVTTAPQATATSPPPSPTTLPPTTNATSDIEPIGDPLSTADLALFEDGLGELAFGSDGIEAVGRLVATFGQPDFDSGSRAAPAVDGGGFCEGELQRQVRWGSLSVYNRIGDDGSETLASAQIRSSDAADPDPAAPLATLSGLAVEDAIAELRRIYDGFGLTLSGDTGGGVWEVRAGSDGRLLVWGTMSGSGEDSDVITSIRSSLRCG